MGLQFLKEFKNKGKRTEKTLFHKKFIAGTIKDFNKRGKKIRTNLYLDVSIKEIDLSTEIIFNKEHKILSHGNVKKTNNLIDVNKYKILSISGSVLNSGGQIQELLNDKSFISRKGFNKIRFKFIWDKYHLNDITAGTLKQEEILNSWEERPGGFSYAEDLKYLKSKKMEIDRGYEYGFSWLIKELPFKIEEEIKKIVLNTI